MIRVRDAGQRRPAVSLWGAVVAAACAAGLVMPGAQAADKAKEHRVSVISRPLFPKQGIYAFNVRVRDEAGRPVRDARVFVLLHSFGADGCRRVPARHTGNGRYYATGRIHEGLEDPRRVRAIVE